VSKVLDQEVLVDEVQEPPPPEANSLEPTSPLRRFKRVALVAVLAALVPYLWVLWDLWTGKVDPFRVAGGSANPASLIYDEQARAMLHGKLSLPTGSIGTEAFIHDGRTYTYFGIFPSLIRMPVLLFTHSLDGRLCAPSMLAAWIVTACFTSLLVWRIRIAIRGPVALRWPEAVSYGLLIFSVLAGSVLMSLASLPWVYEEDEAWGVALAVGTLFVLLGLVERPSWHRLTACGVLVLLTNLNRGTTGYACILGTFLFAAWFFLGRAGPERRRWALPLVGVGLLALVVGCVINVAKFSQLFGYPSSEQLLYSQFGMGRINGGKRFSLHFLPSTLQAYLSPLDLRVSSVFPFLSFPSVPAQMTAHTQLFNRGDTTSVTASMPLLFLAGAWGVVATFGRGLPMLVRSFRLLLLTAALTAGAMMIYGSIFERFLGDFMPLLILASAIGVVDLWRRLDGKTLPGRILVSALAVLALFGFVANVGIAVTPSRYWSETQAHNFVHAEQVISDVTGHPLSRDVVRTDPLTGSKPGQAPIGQLFIQGHCRSLSIAYENESKINPAPWLQVEHAPHTPICDSLIAGAQTPSVSSRVTAPRPGETVQGTVPIVASTSGAGRAVAVSFLLIAGPFILPLGNATHTGSTWTYRWDTRTVRNGTYAIVSKVTNSLGDASASPGTLVTVANPAR
jgi:Bacterial Ig domain